MITKSALNPWQELVQTCVLGSARRDFTITVQHSASGSPNENGPEAGATQLDSFFDSFVKSCENNQAKMATKEEKILTALTAISLAKRSGRQGMTASDLPPAPAVCPEELERVVCSYYSINLLNQVLLDQAKGGESRRLRLLKDWLTFCANANRLIMPAHLPRLLELLKANTNLHEVLALCGGHQLQWLVAQNSDWQETYKDISVFDSGSHLQPDRLLATIETGLEQDRLKAFERLRLVDPALATTCLISLWDKESVDQKMSFLKYLLPQLGMADEIFLEDTVLADKRKDVRLVASSMLARLPASRLVERMRERAQIIVSLSEKNAAASDLLEITLPAYFDKALARDGLEETITIDSRIGPKAGWLYQIVSLVNPAFWQKHTGLAPAAFLKVIMASSEWALPMVLGLLNASALYNDDAWQDAIIAQEEIHLTESQAGQNFLKKLPHAKLERLLLLKLPIWAQTDRRSAPRLDLWYYLELVDFQWSEEFSLALLRFIIKEIREKVPVFGHTFYSNSVSFGLRMHVNVGRMLDEINLGYEELDTWTRNGLERFIDTLKLRYEMRESFLNTDGESVK